jgi:DNA topoisomerase-2
MMQKVLEETFKPVDDSNTSAPSPEKKVRKIRASPFNKKSSSILQRGSTSTEDAEGMPNALL